MQKVAAGIERRIAFKYARKLVRERKVRRLMMEWRVPNVPGNVYTMGYSTVIGRRSDQDVAEFSGSSLNRKKNDKKKKVTGEEVAPGLGKAVNGQVEFPALRSDEESERSVAGGGLAYAQPVENRNRVLAPRSRGKIRDKFNAFFAASGGSTTFATLTFISAVSDTDAIGVLNKWFTSLRKYYGRVNYIWVAERQKENQAFPDNIHFHIMLDRRLSIKRFNALWVMQQYNCGLRGYSHRLGRTVEMDEMKRAFSYNEVHKYFNPFDIRGVKTVTGLSLYLTKYVTKNEDSFACAAWHCSRGVSRMFTKRVISKSLFDETAGEKNSYVNKETGELFEAKTFIDPKRPFFIMRYILNKKYFGQYMNVIEAINKWILKEDFLPDISMLSMDEYYHRYHNQEVNN